MDRVQVFENALSPKRKAPSASKLNTSAFVPPLLTLACHAREQVQSRDSLVKSGVIHLRRLLHACKQGEAVRSTAVVKG